MAVGDGGRRTRRSWCSLAAATSSTLGTVYEPAAAALTPHARPRARPGLGQRAAQHGRQHHRHRRARHRAPCCCWSGHRRNAVLDQRRHLRRLGAAGAPDPHAQRAGRRHRGREAGPLQQMLVGIRTIVESPTTSRCWSPTASSRPSSTASTRCCSSSCPTSSSAPGRTATATCSPGSASAASWPRGLVTRLERLAARWAR